MTGPGRGRSGPRRCATRMSTAAELLIARVRSIDAELAGRLVLVTQRRPIVDDGLEYDRQRIELRPDREVEVVAADETVRLREAFELPDGDDRYVCGLWLSREAYVTQSGPVPAAAALRHRTS